MKMILIKSGKSSRRSEAAPGRIVVMAALLLLIAARAYSYTEKGIASWYGPKFHGKKTANGERYDMNAMTAAHRTLPFGTIVKVLDLDTGREISVRINDRGPFVRGRIIDLSRAAAERLGMLKKGTARVMISAREKRGVYIQAGAFRLEKNARGEARRLKKHGAFVWKDGGYYKVMIGPLRRSLAERTLERLKRQKIQGVIINGSLNL